MAKQKKQRIEKKIKREADINDHELFTITENDKEEMLKRIGVKSIDDLMVDLKPSLNEKLDLSEPMSELELVEHMKKLSQKNKILKYFIGAGAYNHYVPSAINHL